MPKIDRDTRTEEELRIRQLCEEVRRLRAEVKSPRMAIVAARWLANPGTKDAAGELVQRWLEDFEADTVEMTRELEG